jgi:uncharacterized membrane protein YfcA
VVLLIGALIGLVLGLTGAGGSVMAVPLLMGGLGLGLSMSAGLSLGAVASAAAFGVFMRLRQKQIVWPLVAVTGAGGMLLAPVGQWLAGRLSETALVVAFALLVAVIAVRMWQQADRDPESTRVLRAGSDAGAGLEGASCELSPTGRFEWRWPCMQRLLLAGALTGLLSGLFGVGGGFVIVPMLILVSGLPMRQAVATSLAVIVLISSTGFASFLWQQSLPALFWPLAGGALLGMLAGSLLGRFVAGPKLQKGFVILMVLLVAWTLAQQFHLM